MTAYVHRTLICPIAKVVRVRALCTALAGQPGDGMFLRGCVPGTRPAPNADGSLSALVAVPGATVSHYISSGNVEDTFAAVLSDPAVMFAVCQQAGVATTLAECQSILAACDVSAEVAGVALDRKGLVMVAS